MKKEIQKIKIDAKGQSLGRLASSLAKTLLGKTSADFAKNTVADVSIEVENASKILIKDSKRKSTTFSRYSGYPGGLKFVAMEKIIREKGVKELLRMAVYGMLPSNKLRIERMKRLKIKD